MKTKVGIIVVSEHSPQVEEVAPKISVEDVDIERDIPHFEIANDYLLYRFFNYKSSRPVRSLVHLSKEKLFSTVENPSCMISLNDILGLPSVESRPFLSPHLHVTFHIT